MAASDRDREHMRRLGEAKAASHAEAAARHRALPLEERLRRSWALYLSRRAALRASERDDDPSPFYARARRLGMCDP
jgi:hypothetical protein